MIHSAANPWHIYQLSYDAGVLFYSEIDILVLYALISLAARRHKVKILSMCFMINHLHILAQAQTEADYMAFVQCYTSWFTILYNREYCRKGPVFSKPFGHAQKNDPKRTRTTINYIHNNPVEKHLVGTAEKYRWTFLAYAKTNNPFSAEYCKASSSKQLQLAISIVDSSLKRGTAISYDFLWLYKKLLTRDEWMQLTDYIISVNMQIDFELASSYFNGLDSMIRAAHDNTGSEYDINEDVGSRSFMPYYDIIRELCPKRGFPYNLSPSEISEIAFRLIAKEHYPVTIVKKLLHCELRVE